MSRDWLFLSLLIPFRREKEHLDVLPDGHHEARCRLRGLELLIVHAVLPEEVPKLLGSTAWHPKMGLDCGIQAETDVKKATAANIGPVLAAVKRLTETRNGLGFA